LNEKVNKNVRLVDAVQVAADFLTHVNWLPPSPQWTHRFDQQPQPALSEVEGVQCGTVTRPIGMYAATIALYGFQTCQFEVYFVLAVTFDGFLQEKGLYMVEQIKEKPC